MGCVANAERRVLMSGHGFGALGHRGSKPCDGCGRTQHCLFCRLAAVLGRPSLRARHRCCWKPANEDVHRPDGQRAKVTGAGASLAVAQAPSLALHSCHTRCLQAGHVVEESVHGIRTIAAFNLGDEMCSRYELVSAHAARGAAISSMRVTRRPVCASRYRERLAKPQAEGIKSGHTSGFGFGFSQFIMFAT